MIRQHARAAGKAAAGSAARATAFLHGEWTGATFGGRAHSRWQRPASSVGQARVQPGRNAGCAPTMSRRQPVAMGLLRAMPCSVWLPDLMLDHLVSRSFGGGLRVQRRCTSRQRCSNQGAAQHTGTLCARPRADARVQGVQGVTACVLRACARVHNDQYYNCRLVSSRYLYIRICLSRRGSVMPDRAEMRAAGSQLGVEISSHPPIHS
jgi:hypothetical protein